MIIISFCQNKATFIVVIVVFFCANPMGGVKSTPVVVKKSVSSSVTSKKVPVPVKKATTSVTPTNAPVTISGGATTSAAVSALPASPGVPAVPKKPSMPNAPMAPQMPVLPTAPAGFGNFWNNMSNLTTANTNISMNTGNYFGSGATIVGANFGNVNINVAPSVTSSGPLLYF